MRIYFEEMVEVFKIILIKKGFSETDAYQGAFLFAQNSLDGVYSHGVNRFSRVISYIDKGHINVESKATKVDGIGSFERWDGNFGLGNLNAKICMDRAIMLAHAHGIGIVAIKNTNHWMRGGCYGWQAADAGCIGICWTNTQPNMPAWGAKDRRIGNNPFVLAIPRGNGAHVVLDCAMSQFSYGKIEEYKLNNRLLPVDGGFDPEGNLSKDPSLIEKTWRVLPIGFWKGSAMSIALDLAAAVLSGGNTTSEVGKLGEDEYGLSQVLIAIDPNKMDSAQFADQKLDSAISDLKNSEPSDQNSKIYYPGEKTYITRQDNTKNGIPVSDKVWNNILEMLK